MRKIIITAALLAALTLVSSPSAASNREGVWLTGHVQNVGWQLPTNDVAGTTGQSLRLEAIQLVDPVATVRGPMNVTVSVGVAVSADAETGVEWLVGRAREARHAAQCEGGDRVVAAP